MRIRSLKPGFFKNEQLAELSPWHRLCYEGLWCYADREGRMQDRPKRLKAEIFPYDDLDMNHLLWDLARAGFIRRYQIGAHPYIWIPTWHEHQHPRQDEGASQLPAYEAGSDRASATLDTTTFPAARPSELVRHEAVATIDTEPSLSRDDADAGARMGSGVLDLGSGVVGDTPELPASTPAKAHIRVQDLVDLWNATTTPPIPKCRELTEERRAKIRIRLAKRPQLAEWREAFEAIEANAYCRGQNDRQWLANLDWIIRNDTNVVKVLERARSTAIASPPAQGSKRVAGLVAGGQAFLNRRQA